VALIFLSDVHLRLDRPERGQRLARLLNTLGEGDRVVVVGDLCDFWLASRQVRGNVRSCPGLSALAAFRSRGGQLDLLPGNHDAWLGPFYQDVLGVGYQTDALELTIGEVRFRAVHGHALGARSAWKGPMESRWFLHAFGAVPGPLASVLGGLLDSTNSVQRDAIDQKHLAIYRAAADHLRPDVDVCVFGHIHLTLDDRSCTPRVIVLGGWHHQSSYLLVEPSGEAKLVVLKGPG
jgi:UDP-2,3-diacylglucosamine hydrolase